MREVSGSTWTFQIIILFILIFAAFLTLVLSYSKAYIIKNELMDIIEKYEGVTSVSEDIIGNYLYSQSYTTKGTCPINEEEPWYGLIDYTGDTELAQDGVKYYFCYQAIPVYSNVSSEVDPTAYYFNIKVFYRFNLPVIGEIALMKINGRTNSFRGNNVDFGR